MKLLIGSIAGVFVLISLAPLAIAKLPTGGYLVEKVDGGTITTSDRKNTRVFNADEHTVIDINGKPAKLADIQFGDHITNFYRADVTNILTQVSLVRRPGQPITRIAGDTITFRSTTSNVVSTIKTNADTKVIIGGDPATIDAIKVGDEIVSIDYSANRSIADKLEIKHATPPATEPSR